eukprot:TRINITY_DN49857_c0_g2_i1.p2 TRINITY_DN49857_c0_g2~~TRINITY_DN49857_c0_g2_i1.p2  ORF type:complete len:181 (-),score=18.75 TRINITY_DN49857_c0_g2_i1:222-764(-)
MQQQQQPQLIAGGRGSGQLPPTKRARGNTRKAVTVSELKPYHKGFDVSVMVLTKGPVRQTRTAPFFDLCDCIVADHTGVVTFICRDKVASAVAVGDVLTVTGGCTKVFKEELVLHHEFGKVTKTGKITMHVSDDVNWRAICMVEDQTQPPNAPGRWSMTDRPPRDMGNLFVPTPTAPIKH